MFGIAAGFQAGLRAWKGSAVAKVTRIEAADGSSTGPKSSVVLYADRIDEPGGEVLLHLYNYSSAGRNPGSTPTQSLHLDYTSAKALKALIDEVFGTI